MDWDPPKPKPSGITLSDDLSALSVAELDERLAKLHAEIARTDAAKADKLRHNAAADALFGKKS
jgi:uncharacterized small protein (DUF1192 family)